MSTFEPTQVCCPANGELHEGRRSAVARPGAWGAQATSPSNRITVGVIGWGMMAPAIPRHFAAESADCRAGRCLRQGRIHLGWSDVTHQQPHGTRIQGKPSPVRLRSNRQSSRQFSGAASSGRPAPGSARFPRFTRRRRLSATVSSEMSFASRLACRVVLTISPAQSRHC